MSMSGITRRDRREPLVDFLELLFDWQFVDPVRLLVAPDEHVEMERQAVVLGQVVSRVQVVPVEHVACRLRRTPLARVLRA